MLLRHEQLLFEAKKLFGCCWNFEMNEGEHIFDVELSSTSRIQCILSFNDDFQILQQSKSKFAVGVIEIA